MFLRQRGIQMAEFASRIGTTAATVSRIVNRQVVPRRALLEAIHRETSGLVTPNDITGLHPPCVAREQERREGCEHE